MFYIKIKSELKKIELILRGLGFTYSMPHIMYDKYCYWRMAPAQKMHFRDDYKNSITYTINSLGTRGAEFSLVPLK